jgi:hypothetical protein
MPLPRNIKDIIKTLVRTSESEHFIIHYELRNPPDGRGLGWHGVRDENLISTYLNALESLYSTLTSKPWEREPPVVGADGKTHVYVFNCGNPLTYYDEKIPFIFLLSRNNEPTREAELYRATSEAVHEATHLFNYSQRPFYDLNSNPWVWFDEGLAILMEILVGKGNTDYFRFLMDWIDRPEMSLDHPMGKYHAGMFVQYIFNRLGLEFVNDVWMKSNPEESPLEALERLMPEGKRFFSSDTTVRDIFASGYCFEPYCLQNHASDVFTRFGERAVSASLRLPLANGEPVDDQLDHLACRYYRFYLEKGVKTFEVKMAVVDDAYEATPLKAEAAVVTVGGQSLLVEALRLTPEAEGDGMSLFCALDLSNCEEVDHIVVVVSNCGINSSLNGDLSDDGKKFVITASAH